MPDPRRPGQGAQEGRPQEGPQGAAVLQALTHDRGAAVRHRRDPRARQPRPHGRDRARPVGRRRPRARRGRRLRRAVATGRPLAVVGRDPRASGEFLQAAVVAGLASAGVDVQRLGVLPTPAVAYLTAALDADLGRDDLRQPQPDARQRHQVPRPRRAQARRRHRGRHRGPAARAVGPAHRRLPSAGCTRRAVRGGSTSTTWSAPCRTASTALSVVLDCANGAASRVAPAAFAAAGATVHTIHDHTDGYSINDGCGSTHLGDLQRRGRPRAAPTSASPSTATPTGAWRSTPPARSSTATRSWPSSPGRCATAASWSPTPSSPP